MGQTALSAAPNRRKSETPLAALPSAGGAALRAKPPALGPAEWGSPTLADSEPAAQMAVWPVGRAGTVASSGCVLAPSSL
eukprot:15437763-Alexandrium_andersonii.AAC.1